MLHRGPRPSQPFHAPPLPRPRAPASPLQAAGRRPLKGLPDFVATLRAHTLPALGNDPRRARLPRPPECTRSRSTTPEKPTPLHPRPSTQASEAPQPEPPRRPLRLSAETKVPGSAASLARIIRPVTAAKNARGPSPRGLPLQSQHEAAECAPRRSHPSPRSHSGARQVRRSVSTVRPIADQRHRQRNSRRPQRGSRSSAPAPGSATQAGVCTATRVIPGGPAAAAASSNVAKHTCRGGKHPQSSPFRELPNAIAAASTSFISASCPGPVPPHLLRQAPACPPPVSRE